MASLHLHSLSSSNRIRRELEFGEEYRAFKNTEDTILQPVRSPFDVSIFVHRKRYVRKVEENIKVSRSAQGGKRNSSSTSKQGKSKSVPHIKHSFWERAKLTHKQYTDILSTPHLHGSGDNEVLKKTKSQTGPSICSPRLSQMAHPSKRRILGVWQDHEHTLPVEAIQRLHDMLYTTLSIDMKEARNFFKLCDKKKRRLERKQKLKKKKKRNKKEAIWLKNELEETSSAIMNHFTKEPNLETNFKQLLLSDVLLTVLGKLTEKNQPLSRYSSNLYDKELVKLVDKMAIWIDNVSNLVDIQSLEEEDEIAEDEDEKEISKISEESFSVSSTVTSERSQLDEQSKAVEGAGETGQGEATDEELDKVTSLQRLVQILAQASSGYLGKTVEYEDMTRNELLHRLKILNKEYEDGTPADVMKSILMEWAMHNAPEQVDDEIINKIKKMSEILVAMLEAEVAYGVIYQPETERDQKPAAEASKDGEPGSIPGTRKEKENEDLKKASGDIKATEKGKPEPGTLTEIKNADGSKQMAVVDENGEVTPVQLTPSGNLIPTVYDKNAKVVDKVFDKEGNLVDSTFNKYGVPEPDKYNGPLYDDEKKPHELIYNEKGKIIPQCYDKDGNPIAADYDKDGNPLYYGPDGQPVKPDEEAEQKKHDAVDSKDTDKTEEKDREAEMKKEEGVDSKEPEKTADSPKDKEAEKKMEDAVESNEEEKTAGVDSAEDKEAEKKEEDSADSKEPVKTADEEAEKKKEDAADSREPEKTADGPKDEEAKNKKEDTVDSKDPEKTADGPKDEKQKSEDTAGDKEAQGKDPEGEDKTKGETTGMEKKEDDSKEVQPGKTDVEEEGKTKETVSDAEGGEKLSEEKDETKVDKEIKEDLPKDEKTDEAKEKAEDGEKSPEGVGEEIGDKKELTEGEEAVEGTQGPTEQPPEDQKTEEGEELKEGEIKQEEAGEKDTGQDQQGDKTEPDETKPGEKPSGEPIRIGETPGETGVYRPASREAMMTVIKGHAPSNIEEHSEDTVCCLSLKVWAVWLLEITHNAHNWTKWISNIISQIREFAAILRGEILLPNGHKKMMYKEDWNKFIEEMNEDVIAWRQYSRHMNDLTEKIIKRFHGKRTHCCEKCLQDNLIKNVVAAHDTMKALTEALNCTGYWQRCLDEIVQATSKLFTALPHHVDEYSSEGETGWSYSASSEDNDESDVSYSAQNVEPVRQLFPRP